MRAAKTSSAPPNFVDLPTVYQSGALSGRHVRRTVNATRKQIVSRGKRPARIHTSVLALVRSVISNCTGRCVFCCMIVARADTRKPRQTSDTRNLVRSHARNLLSIARLNIARSRVFAASCSRMQLAQISRSFSDGFHDDSPIEGRRTSLRSSDMDENRPGTVLHAYRKQPFIE
jgi:hypothetical protein